MTSTVLITGAGGFAGSFLVERYAGTDWRVHGVYRRSVASPALLPGGIHVHIVDLLDREAVVRLVTEVRPDLLLHLAAQSSVATSWREPLETLMTNAGAQQNLLEAAVKSGTAPRVLIVGSCDEYGNVLPEQNPIDEDYPLRPANPYALSKVTQDLMGYQYFAASGLAVVRVRPFLQLGPRRSDRFVAGSFARQLAEIEAGLRPPIMEVGRLDLRRDFTDVRDVVRAYAQVTECGQAGEVYNIASGEAHALGDVLESMRADAGVTIEIRVRDNLVRADEMPLLVGNAGRLRALTGWTPAIPFEVSCRDTLNYWRQQVAETTRETES